MSDEAKTPVTPNGAEAKPAPDSLARHALRAQLMAISASAAATQAMVEAALATIPLLGTIDPGTAEELRRAVTRPRPPRNEREANFFGKIADSQKGD